MYEKYVQLVVVLLYEKSWNTTRSAIASPPKLSFAATNITGCQGLVQPPHHEPEARPTPG